MTAPAFAKSKRIFNVNDTVFVPHLDNGILVPHPAKILKFDRFGWENDEGYKDFIGVHYSGLPSAYRAYFPIKDVSKFEKRCERLIKEDGKKGPLYEWVRHFQRMSHPVRKQVLEKLLVLPRPFSLPVGPGTPGGIPQSIPLASDDERAEPQPGPSSASQTPRRQSTNSAAHSVNEISVPPGAFLPRQSLGNSTSSSESQANSSSISSNHYRDSASTSISEVYEGSEVDRLIHSIDRPVVREILEDIDAREQLELARDPSYQTRIAIENVRVNTMFQDMMKMFYRSAVVTAREINEQQYTVDQFVSRQYVNYRAAIRAFLKPGTTQKVGNWEHFVEKFEPRQNGNKEFCPICKKNGIRNMPQHVKLNHVFGAKSTYKCPICERIFKSNQTRRKHGLKEHEGEDDLFCPQVAGGQTKAGKIKIVLNKPTRAISRQNSKREYLDQRGEDSDETDDEVEPLSAGEVEVIKGKRKRGDKGVATKGKARAPVKTAVRRVGAQNLETRGPLVINPRPHGRNKYGAIGVEEVPTKEVQKSETLFIAFIEDGECIVKEVKNEGVSSYESGLTEKVRVRLFFETHIGELGAEDVWNSEEALQEWIGDARNHRAVGRIMAAVLPDANEERVEASEGMSVHDASDFLSTSSEDANVTTALATSTPIRNTPPQRPPAPLSVNPLDPNGTATTIGSTIRSASLPRSSQESDTRKSGGNPLSTSLQASKETPKGFKGPNTRSQVAKKLFQNIPTPKKDAKSNAPPTASKSPAKKKVRRESGQVGQSTPSQAGTSQPASPPSNRSNSEPSSPSLPNISD